MTGLTAYLKGFVGELRRTAWHENEMHTHPFPTQVPVWRHLDAPHHRLTVAHFTCKVEAWPSGMIRLFLGANDTEVHGQHAKRLME